MTRLTGRDYVRELARKKARYKCQQCKKEWRIGMRRFDCHHKEGCGIKTKSYDRLKDIKGLVVYCHSCHLNQESVLKKMGKQIRNFKERIARNNEIMELNGKMPRKEIAKKFGISTQMVYLIVGKRGGWKDVGAKYGNEKWRALA